MKKTILKPKKPREPQKNGLNFKQVEMMRTRSRIEWNDVKKMRQINDEDMLYMRLM